MRSRSVATEESATDQEVRARLAAIVDSSDDAIVSKDLTGTIQSWNAGAERIFGYTAAEVVGKSITIIIPPQLLSEEDRILAKMRRGERIDHYETVRRRKDGELVDVSLTVSPIRDAAGRIIGISKIARDITEQKQSRLALAELNRMLERRVDDRTAELQQAIQELESFNYAVSHDLRTPLRAISGFARRLIMEPNLNEDQRRHVAYIVDAAAQMDRVTEALLKISRIKADGLKTSRVDVSRLATRILARLRSEDPRRRVATSVEPGLVAMADAALAEVVLENLLGNAWKFTSKKEEATIHVGHGIFRDQSAFFVQDDGIGLSGQEADRIFLPFQRLRGQEFEGSGIGLATVQKIVRVHGGTVGAEGEPGRFARIWFNFGPDRPL